MKSFIPPTVLLMMLCLALEPRCPAADTLLKDATYCHELNENQSAKDKAESFQGDEPVRLSIELKGRPKSGVASAKFYFRDQLMVEAKVDVAEVNKGVLFSVGQSTYVGFTLKPVRALPVGECYRTEVTFDGKALGTFPFVIAPPKDSIPSKLISVTMARGVDENNAPVGETRTFTPSENVVLAGKADLGLSTWLEVEWKIGGKADDEGTRSITMKENKKDVPFYFLFCPKNGWPEGEHEAVLTMNGKVVGKEKFTVEHPKPEKAGSNSKNLKAIGKGLNPQKD